jgi:hypothetical protein
LGSQLAKTTTQPPKEEEEEINRVSTESILISPLWYIARDRDNEDGGACVAVGGGGEVGELAASSEDGVRWDKFKAGVSNVANRVWNKISPNLVSAGKAASPRAAEVLLNPFANKSEGLKGVAMNFGKDLANSFIPGVTNMGRRRRVVGSRIRRR